MSKILFLINTLMVGGAEHVLVDIANRMAEDGYDVTVKTIFDVGDYKKCLSGAVNYQSIFKYANRFTFSIINRLCRMLPAQLLYRFVIKAKYDYEVAFVEGIPTKIIAGSSNTDSKRIAWVHTDLSKNYESRSAFRSEDENLKCYRRFDEVLCVSEDARKGFEQRLEKHPGLAVQYNPLDKTSILTRALEEPVYKLPPKSAFRLVAVGRLASVKGFDMLIEAMERVHKSVTTPVELYIIGGGEEEERLKALVHHKQLTHVVQLCGQQSNPYSIMQRCDAQIVSSRAEGYSLVLCEGHMLGIPAIATKCAGPIEIISASKAGILVDISVKGLADGIIEMINNASIVSAYKENAANWSSRYDPDAIYSEIEAHFTE